MTEHTDSLMPLITASPQADAPICREAEAPWSAAEARQCVIGRIPWTEGIKPQPRALLPGYDSGVMALLLGVFVIIALNFRHYSTFLSTFTQNLFSVRQRANAFDEKSTVSEARILVSLIILTCVCEGVIGFSAVTLTTGLTPPVFPAIGALSLLALAYYLWQIVAYNVVGYTFTSAPRRKLWVKGFNASQSLLGITLTVPALAILFNPQLGPWLIALAALLYIIARVIFIIKGFRIFYNKSFALLYFILYLCSLEIIPLIIISNAAIFLLFNLQGTP